MHGTLPQPTLDAEDRRPRARARIALVVGALLLVAAIAAWLLIGRRSAPAAAPAAAPLPVVTVVVPGRAPIGAEVRLTGSIAARRASPVGVQGEGGMIVSVRVKEGDYVRRGQVLASIDRAVQQQQMAQMTAGIRQAEADAALATAELERAKTLVQRGFISKADIDRKTATRDSAFARVNVARAQAGELRARIARLDVRAPTDGLILARSVEAGQVVGIGSSALFTLAEDGAMEMRGRVAEQDLAGLRLGQSARVRLVGAGDAFTGRVWLIDPTIDPQARQGSVRIALGSDRRLRPGAFANATITTGAVDRPQLPQSAVQSDEKGNYVLIVGAGDKVEQRRVEVGEVADKGLTIRSGLTGQERVVMNAGAFLNPGERVKPVSRASGDV